MSDHDAEEVLARFEELTVLETEFEDAELEIIRKQNALYAPLYKKRAEVIAKIPHFWALVFEQSPPEVDNFIQPSDSNIFAECLESFEVSRFDIDNPKGSPRSFSIKWGFKKNEYFEDTVLEKKFWFRRALDGWMGLVSEPVKINWKKGKDATGGLTDAAYNLFQAKQKLGADAKKKETSLPEYKALAEKIEQSEDASVSFFAFFGYVSSWKFVSAEESEKAFKVEAENLEKRKRGEKVEEDESTEEDDEQDYQETEVFPQADELATIIAEDMWPSAIKYYKHAHEADDEILSDISIEEYDSDEDSDVEMDIRALVGKGKNSKGTGETPPAKKQRRS
ncbi:hypothetical protein GQ43DRAFT_428978 [Delitschia confertaspora ATCC 74209]|uniref:NAP family protein n=1 Tax=Delitschia confertaspora ATCC 74209 TaxID=1513339 RepID=A0A9P4JSB2_9PLEO|nr:hypothetical protein GQ43DRAFT_428978 [Delitschia confertaspora ATCC 74209]